MSGVQKCIRCAFKSTTNDPKFLGKDGKSYVKTCDICRGKKKAHVEFDYGLMKKCTDCPFISTKDDETFVSDSGVITKRCKDCRDRCNKRDAEHKRIIRNGSKV